MENTIILIDAAFLSKLSKYFGGGKYLVYDIVAFSKNLASEQKLNCKHIFCYTAPPFQSNNSTNEEIYRFKKYEEFKNRLLMNDIISIREGRCQRLKIDGKYVYHQKAVDILLAMDLMSVPIKYPNIKKIILIASDSDFVPVIMSLENEGIKTILYTYYEEKRNTNLSRSNYLIKSVHKYVKLTKEDFTSCPIIKEVNTDKNKNPVSGDLT